MSPYSILSIRFLCIIHRAVISTAALVCAPHLTAAVPFGDCDRTIAEAELRRNFIINKVDPAYPIATQKAGLTGIAVAEVCIPAGSNRAVVRIATAPDSAVAVEVKGAIERWKFGPFTAMGDASHFLSYSTKIIYYFTKINGTFVVRSSSDSFLVGPHFAMKQPKPSL